MFWKIFQGAVAFAVIASNIHYGWTPNPYAASVVALFAALAATVVLSGLGGLVARLRGLRFFARQALRAQEGGYRDISGRAGTSEPARQWLGRQPRR